MDVKFYQNMSNFSSSQMHISRLIIEEGSDSPTDVIGTGKDTMSEFRMSSRSRTMQIVTVLSSADGWKVISVAENKVYKYVVYYKISTRA